MLSLLLALVIHPDFNKDIAALVYKHCAQCHHDGEVAPFSLITYEDVSKRASQIAAVTRKGLMPPWKPVSGYGRFSDERRLSTVEIQTIQSWVAAGAPRGDRRNARTPPVFSKDWELGQPDLVIQLPQPMEIPADGPDVYECFVTPMELPGDRFIRAVEFRPSNRRVVHHALLFSDASHIAREPRYSCFGTLGLLPTLGIGGWSPGNKAIRMPEGADLPLRAGSKLVAQVHYHPDGKPERDQWSVGFYFTDKAPVRRVVDVGLASRAIDIPAGDQHYVVRQHFTIPIAVDAFGIIPHAHLLCREMRGWAILPGGRKVWLLNIRDWDFNWQAIQIRRSDPLTGGHAD